MAEDINDALVAEQEAIVAEIDDISDRVAAYKKMKKVAKEAEARAEEYRKEIASYLESKEAEYGTIGGKLAMRWRTIVTNRFDTKKFRKQNPDVADMYTVTSETHRLEVIEE
jgi:predicted phage-related endonuclease